MFEFIETKRHTVESVYGRPEAEILALIDPKFEAVEFRMTTGGELCFGPRSLGSYLSWANDDGPRLILRRKTVKRRVLTETGEVRRVKVGEWYRDGCGVAQRCFDTTWEAYPIYRETFVEVEA